MGGIYIQDIVYVIVFGLNTWVEEIRSRWSEQVMENYAYLNMYRQTKEGGDMVDALLLSPSHPHGSSAS